MRKKQKRKMIAHNARNTTTKARECIKSMQSLVDHRQLILNPVSSEVLKSQSVVRFSGDTSPHFFQWKKDALQSMKHLGIPLAYQGSHIKTYLKGEAKDKVNAELALVSLPTIDNIASAEILGCHYGDPHMILKQLIGAHKSYGKVPSHIKASWEAVHHIVSKHCKIINIYKELAAGVGEERTIYSWPYLEELEMGLSPTEQHNLRAKNNNSRERFTELEKVYKELKEDSLFWMTRFPESKIDQGTYTAVGFAQDEAKENSTPSPNKKENYESTRPQQTDTWKYIHPPDLNPSNVCVPKQTQGMLCKLCNRV